MGQWDGQKELIMVYDVNTAHWWRAGGERLVHCFKWLRTTALLNTMMQRRVVVSSVYIFSIEVKLWKWIDNTCINL